MALHARCFLSVILCPVISVREEHHVKISTEIDTNLPAGFPAGYSSVSLVGQGGFGKVFKGIASTGEVHAIKIPNDATDLEQKCKDIQNIQEMVRVQNGPPVTHIMNCIGSREIKDIYGSTQSGHMVLEWSGTEGHKAIKSCNFDQAMGLFKQLLIGLVSLHRKPPMPVIVHHDLKWQNVGVEDNCLRIIDLEDVTPGIWGKRNQGAPAYTYETPETVNNKWGFFCGRTGGDPNSLCPYAWAYDAYTAGIMMAQLFGIDLLFYLNYWGSLNSQGRQAEAQHFLIRESILLIPSVLLDVGQNMILGSTTKKFVQQLRSLARLESDYDSLNKTFSDEYQVIRGYALNKDKQVAAFSGMDIKMLRLKELAKLDVSSLNMLEGLLSPDPKERSSAGQVLSAPAFRDRNTLCRDDDVPEQKTSLKSNTQEEVTRITKAAVIKNQLRDLDPTPTQPEVQFKKGDIIPGTTYAMPFRQVVKRRTDQADCSGICPKPSAIKNMQGVQVKSSEFGFLKFMCHWGKNQPPKHELCSSGEWDARQQQYRNSCACPWLYT